MNTICEGEDAIRVEVAAVAKTMCTHAAQMCIDTESRVAHNSKNSSTVSPASLMIAFNVPFGISDPG